MFRSAWVLGNIRVTWFGVPVGVWLFGVFVSSCLCDALTRYCCSERIKHAMRRVPRRDCRFAGNEFGGFYNGKKHNNSRRSFVSVRRNESGGPDRRQAAGGYL